MKRLRFKESLYVQVVEPDTVFLVSETDYHLLTSPIYKHLAPLLQEGYTASALTALLSGKVPPAHVKVALNRLEANGYIVEIDDDAPASDQTPFWHAATPQTATTFSNLQQKTVAVRAVGMADGQPLHDALASLDLSTGEIGDVCVVVTDDYLNEGLAAINQAAMHAKQPWLLTRLVGESVWIGPLFVPDETACWECMAHRIRINRPVETFVQKKRVNKESTFTTARSALNATVSMGANMVATEVAKWVATGDLKHFESEFVTFNTLKLELDSHHVIRRPQCPVCGDSDAYRNDREPAPVQLHPAPKDQIPAPDEALARYERNVFDPIVGVVTHLVEAIAIQGLGYGYISVHAFSSLAEDIRGLQRNLQGRSSGKGQTKTQAKLSAIGEAVERYSGVYWKEGEIEVKATYNEMGERAIPPNDVWLYSQQQYDNRLEWNRALKSTYHIVHKPLDPDLELNWVPFWSLTQERFKYLPAYSTYYGHPDTFKVHGSCDSNGCAAGPTLEDAVLKGFFELVERDCAALWWYNRLRRPRVDTSTFDMPYVQELEAYYTSINRTLWVLDITADLGIPTFVAVSARTDRDVEDILIGMGVDFDPKVALMRALAEVNQFLSDVFYTNEDGSTHYHMDVEETVEWFKTARLADHSYLVPDDTQPVKTLADFPYRGSHDSREEVETCVRLAEGLGMETFVLNQTRPDIEIAVARVVVPGLRHFWRRLAPGRLYEVPVKMGWLDKPLTEDELNPVSMFF